MTDQARLHRLRGFLFALAAGLFVGAIVELALIGHVDKPIQRLPFAMGTLGLITLVGLWWRPGQGMNQAARVVLALLVLTSMVGVALHFQGNLEFARETWPDADFTALFWHGLRGRSPLLAPGILAIAGTVAVATTLTAAPSRRVAADHSAIRRQ